MPTDAAEENPTLEIQQPGKATIEVRKARHRERGSVYLDGTLAPNANRQISAARKAVIGTLDLRALLFGIGVMLVVAGLGVARGDSHFPWMPGFIRDTVGTFVVNYEAIIVGLAISLAGALLAGWAKKDARYDKVTALPLAAPAFNRDPAGIAALVVGVAAYGTLCFHLLNNAYKHFDIALFFAAIALFCLAIHRFDLKSGRSTAAARIFHRADAIAAVGLGLLSALVNANGLIDWRVAWWGDEGAFFGAAREIARGTASWNFFDLTYVYNAHPLLDSLYQGLVMKVAGLNVVGWRASEVLLVAATTALLYLLGTALLGRVQAVAACVILGTGYYLMAFTRLAYNNMHVIFYGVLVMLMVTLAWRTHRAVFVFATGMSVGLCLYTFSPALLSGPVIALVLAGIFLRRPGWRQVSAGLLMLAGFLLIVIPGLLVTPLSELLQVASQNSYGNTPQNGPVSLPVISLVDSVVAFWANNQWRHHYVGDSLLDPISGGLVLLGIGIAVMGIRRRSYVLPLVWLLGTVVLVALTDLAPEAHLTRLMLALPGAALLGGIAVGKLFDVLRTGMRLPAKASALLVACLLALIPAVNAHQFLVEGAPLQGGNWFPLVVKTLYEYPDRHIIQVGHGTKGDENLAGMLTEYPWLQDYYAYSHVGNLQRPFAKSAGELPVFLFVQEDQELLDTVANRLQDGYYKVVDADSESKLSRSLLVPPGVIAPVYQAPGYK